jgi:hypothetical protein
MRREEWWYRLSWYMHEWHAHVAVGCIVSHLLKYSIDIIPKNKTVDAKKASRRSLQMHQDTIPLLRYFSLPCDSILTAAEWQWCDVM